MQAVCQQHDDDNSAAHSSCSCQNCNSIEPRPVQLGRPMTWSSMHRSTNVLGHQRVTTSPAFAHVKWRALQREWPPQLHVCWLMPASMQKFVQTREPTAPVCRNDGSCHVEICFAGHTRHRAGMPSPAHVLQISLASERVQQTVCML